MFVQNREPGASVHRGLDGHPVVRLSGEYDIANADDLSQALETAWRGRPARIVIDLSEASFMDASAAARITSFCRQVPPEKRRIVLRHPQRIVRLVLELVGLDGLCEPEGRAGGLVTIHPLHPPG